MSESAKDRVRRYVDRHPEGVTPGELAKKLRISPRTVSNVLGDLETEGFIQRQTKKGKAYPAGIDAPKAGRTRSASRPGGRPVWVSPEAVKGWGGLAVLVIGLAFRFGILRPRQIAEHQHEALAWLFKAGPAGRNIAERFLAQAQIIVLGQHASEDPAERQRQVAEAELAAAERELTRRVQWRDNLDICVKASPGPRMVSGLEGLGIIRPLPSRNRRPACL